MSECKFRVGDKVWSPSYGNGEVMSVDDDLFPIKVKFNNDITEEYLHDGRCLSYENPTLFFEGSYIVEAPEPYRRYLPKAGDAVAVSYDNETWAIKIFHHICPETGKYFATSCVNKGTMYRYDFCEPAHKHFNIPDKS